MFDDDQSAVAAVYDAADSHRAVFDRTHSISATPWPFAIFEWSPPDHAPPEVQRALAIIRRNTTRLMAVVAEHGWPGRSVVGEDGATAAWLVLQHAGSGVTTIGTPENHAFRRLCVPLIERAVLAGEAHPRHLAHVVDGIQEVEGGRPLFAVLSTAYRDLDGRAALTAGLHIGEIDRRRAAIRLPPVDDDIAGISTRPIRMPPWEPWPTPGSTWI